MTNVANTLRQKDSIREWVRRARTRLWKARYRTPHVDNRFLLSRGCTLSLDLVAGPYGFMNEGCRVCAGVTIGKYVMCGPEVLIAGADHRFEVAGTPMIFSGRPELPSTKIEDDVWLGARSIIIAGCRIGRGSIVAAGSIVTRDVEPYSIVAGSPARLVRKRFGEAEQALHDEMLAMPPALGRYCDPKG